MKEPLLHLVEKFIEEHLQGKRKFLLAFSGGADSTALFNLLLDLVKRKKIELYVAHFDHGWRKESGEQRRVLQKLVEGLGIPFYAEKASSIPVKDKENQARESRYCFLSRVYKKVGAEALFLGHQRKDLAQTVLKRALEGSSISSLCGMESISFYGDMACARPLLYVPREDLLHFLERNGISFLDDYTNEDLLFLRPRMEQKIFPYIEEWFEKKIERPLALLGEEGALLKQYMHRRLEPFLQKEEVGSLGSFLPMDRVDDPFERRELARYWLKSQGVSLSKDSLALTKRQGKECIIPTSKGIASIDVNGLFFSLHPLIPWTETISFTKENFPVIKKEWTLSMGEEKPSRSLRKSFLLGEVSITLPQKGILCGYSALCSSAKKQASSFFSHNKIPPRLRKIFPFVINEGRLFDLFSFFNLNQNNKKQNDVLKINLKKI